jgi:hypothetical protein
VRDREDRGTGTAVARVQHRAHVERLALEPGVEARGRQEIVELGGEGEPVLRRIERFQIQRADARHRGRLDGLDQGGDVEVASLRPRGLEELGHQDVLAAPEGVRVDAEQAQEARGGGRDALAQEILVVTDRGARRGERADHRDGPAGRAPRSIDDHVGRLAQAADAVPGLAPVRQALRPAGGLVRRVGLEARSLLPRLVGIDPRREVLRSEIREREEQVGQIPFGIDHQGGNAVEQGLLEQRQAQAGLAAARHPDAHGVGDEVLRVVEEESALGPARR